MKDLPTLQEIERAAEASERGNSAIDSFINGACYVREYIRDNAIRGLKITVHNALQEEIATDFLMLQGFGLDPVFKDKEDHLKDATYPSVIYIDSNGYIGATPLDKE